MAGCLALIAVVNNNKYHTPGVFWGDNASYYATVLLDGSNGSNISSQTFALNKVDVNLDMNVWASVQTTSSSSAALSGGVLPVAFTNRMN
jgi:hypothetical protein